MRRKCSKTGFTLAELLVVMAVILILVVVAVPAAKELIKSFQSTAGLRPVIDAALCNARALAAKRQCYAGVRFQQDLKGRQYMVFICHDPGSPPTQGNLNRDPLLTGTGLASGFRAIEGRKPIAFPANAGVMDLRVKDYLAPNPSATDKDIEVVGDDVASNENINDTAELLDTTTFSIVFSPAGKLVVHDVRVRNRTGRTLTDSDASLDDVFNTTAQTDAGVGMFYQDDYPSFGLVEERSRNCFVIYDKKEFEEVGDKSRWSEYLKHLEVIYVNPHTGEIVNK